VNRAQLRKVWNRTRPDPRFRRLLHLILAALAAVPSTAKDQLAACAPADFTLRRRERLGGGN
jgi:hypothetical protein